MSNKIAFFILLIIVTQMLVACAGSSLFAPPTATAVPTPTNDPQSSAKVVQAFWDALEAGDVEKAMTYVDEHIECTGYCHFTGKRTLQSYLQGYLNAGFSTEISDVKNVGSIVTYSWEVYRNGHFLMRSEGDETMQVEDGKIVFWENYHR